MAYSIDTNDVEDLSKSIDALEAASKTLARSRNTKVGPLVDAVCEHAYQHGLLPPELHQIVRLLTVKTELDQSSCITLIKHMYPATPVSSENVAIIVNCLGQAKRNPGTAIQVSLIRWLIAIYDVLEEQTIISRLYSVLFDLLDMITLRPLLCQLLAISTKRKHVRPFRIQRLIEFVQQTAGEPALLNLLSVYKNFCPDIIAGTTIVAKLPNSLLPDPEWRQRLRVIQQNNAFLSGATAYHSGFQVARTDIGNDRKPVVPVLQTFHASETIKTLEEVHSATELVDSLESIETPSQLASALRDPLFQKYLQLNRSEDAARRLDFWLWRHFLDELQNINEGFGLSSTLSELLRNILSYTETNKILPSIVEQFLQNYLRVWNGSSDQGVILDLLSYLPPQPFRTIHDDMLSVLERSVLSGAHASYDMLFGFYTTLATRWMNHPQDASEKKTPRGFLKSSAVFDLTQHVAMLAQSCLASGYSSHAAVLCFYENLTHAVMEQISSRKQLLPPVLPPRVVAYTVATSGSLTDFSRLCALFARYKKCFERQETGVVREYQSNGTELLNGYLMDICNMIWRSRALNATDTNASGMMCPSSVATGLQTYLTQVERDYSIHTTFDFSHSTLTAALAQVALSEIEVEAQRDNGDDMPLHAGPATQRSLTVLEKEGGVSLSWQHYRVAMLSHFEQQGLDGMKILMFATMKDLMR